MLLGPAILFNEEYFERRCGNVPKPGVFMHLGYKLIFLSFLFEFFRSLSFSKLHVMEDHFFVKLTIEN